MKRANCDDSAPAEAAVQHSDSLVTNAQTAVDICPTLRSQERQLCGTESCGSATSQPRQSKLKEPAFLLRCSAKGCGQTFSKRARLDRHMLSHSDERHFKCQTCGAAFKRKEHLERHTTLRHIIKGGVKKETFLPRSSDCPSPNRDTEKSMQLNKYACEHCGKAFVLNYHLRRHLKTHMPLHKCKLCDERFARKKQLRRHMLLHLLTRPSDPQNSTANSTPDQSKNVSKAPLVDAKISEHAAVGVIGAKACGGAKEIDTPKPEAAFPVKDSTDHKHSEGDSGALQPNSTGGLVCPHQDCGKVFTSLDQLYRHLRRAAQRQRDYVCIVCKASFPVFSALVAHRRLAHSSKHHACEHCGKAYTRPDRLRAHLNAKHPFGDTPADGDEMDASCDAICNFQCSQCSLCFSSKSNLRVHIRVKHLNERRFPCSQCGMKFAYKAVLRRHVASIHGGTASSRPAFSTDEPQREAGVPHSETKSQQEASECQSNAEGKDSSQTAKKAIRETTGLIREPSTMATGIIALSEPKHAQMLAAGEKFLVDAVSVDLVVFDKTPR